MVGATSPPSLPARARRKPRSSLWRRRFFRLVAALLRARARASRSRGVAARRASRIRGVRVVWDSVRKMNDSQMDTSICVPLAVTFWIYCPMPRKTPWFLITWPRLRGPLPPQPPRTHRTSDPRLQPLSFISLTSYLFSRLSNQFLLKWKRRCNGHRPRDGRRPAVTRNSLGELLSSILPRRILRIGPRTVDLRYGRDLIVDWCPMYSMSN